jgi:hypothetical protein
MIILYPSVPIPYHLQRVPNFLLVLHPLFPIPSVLYYCLNSGRSYQSSDDLASLLDVGLVFSTFPTSIPIVSARTDLPAFAAVRLPLQLL